MRIVRKNFNSLRRRVLIINRRSSEKKNNIPLLPNQSRPIVVNDPSEKMHALSWVDSLVSNAGDSPDVLNLSPRSAVGFSLVALREYKVRH